MIQLTAPVFHVQLSLLSSMEHSVPLAIPPNISTQAQVFASHVLKIWSTILPLAIVCVPMAHSGTILPVFHAISLNTGTTTHSNASIVPLAKSTTLLTKSAHPVLQ